MILIQLPEVLPEDIENWKQEAERITQQIIAEEDAEVRKELIDRHQDHWRKEVLINWLSDLSFEKCWYTETKFGGDYQELEHFRPKKSTKNLDGKVNTNHPGYYWLAFDLDNYRLCKRRPNAKKSTFFPIIDERFRACCKDDDWRDEQPYFLDPMDDEDVLLISFNEDGLPTPSLGIEEQDIDRVNFTIEKYYLDERVLNKRRAEVWKTTRDLYNKYVNQMRDAKAKPRDKVALRAAAKKDLESLKKLLKPHSEFSSVARESLLKTGEPIAIKIASSNNL